MTETTYVNLDLLVETSGTGYRAMVVGSPVGEAAAQFILPPGEQDALALETLDPNAAKHLGKALFDAIFRGDVLTCLRRSLDEALRREAGLRIRLRLDKNPELTILPWEYLYDPTFERFLALSEETPVVRYLHLPEAIQPLAVEPPIRMLALTANPRDYPPLDVEQEWQTLREALVDSEHQGRVELVRLETPSLSALRQQLRQGEYHILHFAGHGYLDDRTQDGVLLLEDEQGRAHAVTRQQLSTLLHDHRSLRLVFLNACQGATVSRTDLFAGMAQGLVQQGIPVVVAMQSAVTDRAATILVREFYRALAKGHPVDASLTEARRAVFLLGNTAEWGIPVLFSRLPDNQLLTVPVREDTKYFEPETIRVLSGSFLMGSPRGEGVSAWETPQHKVELPAFYIGRYPVTNEQYAEFVKREKGQDVPRKVGWFLREPSLDKLDHPVVGVSWHDAQAYCRWLSNQTGRHYRLPTEAEWEKAARGTDSLVYPWGDEWDPSRCNHSGGQTTPVDAYPDGVSPCGCHDMVGNVEEWVSTLWGSSRRESDFPYLYQADDGREDPRTDEYLHRVYRVHRGGSCQDDDQGKLRCSARGRALAQSATKTRGFRVAMDD